MKETGILMVADMVIATLEGRKTNTRRLKRLDALNLGPYKDRISKVECRDGLWCFWETGHGSSAMSRVTAKCPYGGPGDRLWVRETWQRCENCGAVNWLAGGNRGYCSTCDEPLGRWKPSIHMFREYSRITLEILTVRVERVQNISEEDAKAEGVSGVEFSGEEWMSPLDCATTLVGKNKCVYDPYRTGFLRLWNSINAKRGFGWDVNPWVWVVEFKEVKR